MKVVSISLDPKVLDSKSAVSFRNRHYGKIVDEYRVVVHDKKDSILELTDSVTIYGVGGASKFVRLIRIAFLLRRFIKEKKCDVIASSDPYYLSVVAYIIARMYHVGLEIHILGIEKLNPIRSMVARFIIKRAGSVRVNSTRLRDRLSKEFDVSWEEILFVPIYIPVDELGFGHISPGSREEIEQVRLREAFRSKYEGRFNFLFVGRLVHIKNIPMQLRAMAKLKDRHKEALLHIVGDGPDNGQLEGMIKDMGLEEHVILEGRKDGVALGIFYTECDCFLLTSFSEGWGMVIVEAATAGLPVVMTDVGCAGEMIVDGKNGLVVPVNDVDALVEAMSTMITDNMKREALKTAGLQYVTEYWKLGQILEGYRQSWEKALKRRY